jgi:hypothetical protein
VGDIGRLGRPGGEGPRPGNHQQEFTAGLVPVQLGPVAQEAVQDRALPLVQGLLQLDEMPEFGIKAQISAQLGRQAPFKLAQAEIGKGGGAA